MAPCLIRHSCSFTDAIRSDNRSQEMLSTCHELPVKLMTVRQNVARLRRTGCTRAVREVTSHFEYLENRSRGLDVTWQPVSRGDLTVLP